MPSEFATLDTSFPNLEGKTTEEKLQSMTDYLYQLLEQLRYILHNLGVENMNEESLKDIINMSAKAIDLTGYVTFHSLETPGETVIDGGNITANSIHLTKLGNDVTGSFGDANPEYIKSTYIDFRQVVSPAVYAGDFYGAKYHDLNGYGTLYIMGSQAGYYTLYFGPPSANPGILDAKFGVRVLGDGTLELYLNGLNVLKNGVDSDGYVYTTGEYRWRFDNLVKFNHEVILKSGHAYGTATQRTNLSNNWSAADKLDRKGLVFFEI